MRFRDCKMAEMTPEDYQKLVELLDGQIDELTKPIPSKQILRFAEAIRSATIGDMDSVGTYNQEDYANHLDAQSAVNDLLPPILESIRATSIDPETGWRLAAINAGNGDYGACSICEKPFQHFHESDLAPRNSNGSIETTGNNAPGIIHDSYSIVFES